MQDIPLKMAATVEPTPGYHGRYLHVDLSARVAWSKPLPAKVLRQFLGGSGLGTYLLLQGESAETLPLDPAASLAFVFSPLVGSPVTTSAKFAVVAKSPLTGRLNDSLASSRFAITGKGTGFDAIVLSGKAEHPILLIVESVDGVPKVRLEDARDLWGTTCTDAAVGIKDRFGKTWSCAVIGPAGEAQIPFATVSHDGRHAGRGGSGAVLGSKNVKAVVVRGNETCEWSNPAGLASLAKSLSAASFGPATSKYRELGTATNLLAFNRLNALPTRNFQQGSFESVVNLAPETLVEGRTKTRAYCAACTIGCEHIYSLGGAQAKTGVRIEYENLFALGPLCAIDDPEVVLTASQRCDELGLDTISVGGTVAFAMECMERGYLDESHSWLKFGDGAALSRAVECIVTGEGIGSLLRLGSREMAGEIGMDSLDFAPQVKGLEIPGYEPRGLQTMALGFAVGTRGADHNRSGAYEFDFSDQVDRRNFDPNSATLAIQSEDQAALLDSLILCKFLRGVFQDFFKESAELLHLVTGWQLNAADMRKIAEGIVTARKVFNIRAGWTPDEDTLPERFFVEHLPDDHEASLSREALKLGIAAYNLQRGWDEHGWVRGGDKETGRGTFD